MPFKSWLIIAIGGTFMCVLLAMNELTLIRQAILGSGMIIVSYLDYLEGKRKKLKRRKRKHVRI
jgi:hypothetical protein